MKRIQLIGILSNKIDGKIVTRLVDNYIEFKHSIFLSDIPSKVTKAGLFLEEAMKALNYVAYKAELKKINRDQWLTKIEKSNLSEYERLQLPRVIYGAYEIRNRKKSAHSTGIDPLPFDVEYLDMTCSWILSEFLRLYHSKNQTVISNIITSLIQRKVPQIEEIEENILFLNQNMKIADKIILTVYKKDHCKQEFIEKQLSVQHKNPTYIRKIVTNLKTNATIYEKKNKDIVLTQKGKIKAEEILKFSTF